MSAEHEDPPALDVINYWLVSYVYALTPQRAIEDFQGIPIDQIFREASASGDLKPTKPLPPKKARGEATRATAAQFKCSTRTINRIMRPFHAAEPERRRLAAERLQADNEGFITYLALGKLLGPEGLKRPDPSLDLRTVPLDILTIALAAKVLAEENAKLRAERDAAGTAKKRGEN